MWRRIGRIIRTTAIGIGMGMHLAVSAYGGAPSLADAKQDIRWRRFDSWAARDGLPPREIEAIQQTHDGFLWLATRAGLVRFDGMQFQRFDSRNTPGLTRDMIRSLFATREKELWVGTDGGGFGVFRKDGFHPLKSAASSQSWSEQRTMLQARDGSLWVGGNGSSPLQRIKQGKTYEIPNFYANILALAEDAEGRIWAGGAQPNLARQKPNGGFELFEKNPNAPKDTVKAICTDRKGSVWIGTEKQGLYRYQGGVFVHYSEAQGLASNAIQSLYCDHEGMVWIGTRNGLSTWNGSRFATYRQNDGLPANSIGPMLEDQEGNVWIAAGKGLTRIRRTKLTPFALGAGGEKLTIHAQLERQDGSLCFATSDGLYILSQSGSKSYGRAEGLPAKAVLSLAETKDGTLWLLCEGGSVVRFAGGKFETLPRKIEGWHIAADKYSLIFEERFGQLTRYKNGATIPLSKGGAPNYAFMFYEDKKGVLWCASQNGLGRISENGVQYLNEGLPKGTHVLGVTEDMYGTLWVSSDHGLARFEQGRFHVYDRHAGLPDDNLYQIQSDSRGRLWIGCNLGVFSVTLSELNAYDAERIRTLPYTLFDSAEGVQSYPILFGAMRTRDGRLWFQGDNGVTVVAPSLIRPNIQTPPVLVESVKFNEKPYDPSLFAEIAPGEGRLEIRYAAVSLGEADRVRYRYQLERYDKDWVEAGGNKIATYSHLPPGDYRFHIMASNSDGIWSDSVIGLRFQIQPFYYQTLWFKLLCGLMSLSALAIAVRWRLNSLQRQNAALEAKVIERTRALEQANLELRDTQERIENMNAELEASNDELNASLSELAHANDKLATMATTDGLTGLANHRIFQERLQREWAHHERTGARLSLLLLDVDFFKQYNDSFGHPAGDEVLRQASRLLRENVRENDLVARYGGEEFAALLPGASDEDVRDVAERLRGCIANSAFPNRRITISVGVASASGFIETSKELLERADKALYAAKHSGRNCVAFDGAISAPHAA